MTILAAYEHRTNCNIWYGILTGVFELEIETKMQQNMVYCSCLCSVFRCFKSGTLPHRTHLKIHHTIMEASPDIFVIFLSLTPKLSVEFPYKDFQTSGLGDLNTVLLIQDSTRILMGRNPMLQSVRDS